MGDDFFGTLNDVKIKEYCDNGSLIVEDFDANLIKQACYELRSGSIYYDLANGKKKYSLQKDDYILIKPKQQVVIITKEKLNLPNDILGRILTKGQLFSIGILPVNTYADPGFIGRIGIVLHNLSNEYIKIIQGQSIAKIEFSKLRERVETPYHGQHGYEMNIWPITEDSILTKEEIASNNKILSEDKEIELSYGKNISSIITRIAQYERKFILSSGLYFLLMLIILYKLDPTTPDKFSYLLTISLGVFANIATMCLTYMATKFWGK
ncbi:deoxycytidine triphosphate deaminase [Candidatus Magnetomorum sp. HK-1]|nr:deoxycytidine triphosphate deaminase [Candidatus Magnetomorum sp. HK-1]